MKIKIYKKVYKRKKIMQLATHYLGTIQWGIYGLKSLTHGILTTAQLEMIRRLITRTAKRLCKITIRVFFKQPLTKKGLGVRMGKGVGAIKAWIAYVKPGLILLEITNISYALAKNALLIAKKRLPIRTSIVLRTLQ